MPCEQSSRCSDKSLEEKKWHVYLLPMCSLLQSWLLWRPSRAWIAQSVEHQTFNLRVQGSSPCSGVPLIHEVDAKGVSSQCQKMSCRRFQVEPNCLSPILCLTDSGECCHCSNHLSHGNLALSTTKDRSPHTCKFHKWKKSDVLFDQVFWYQKLMHFCVSEPAAQQMLLLPICNKRH